MPRPSISTHTVRRLARRSAAAVALAGSFAVAAPAMATERPPVTPIPSLDVPRYLGEWRQIASIPQWFEAFCVSDTVANYSLNDDNTVRVSNRCVGPLGANIVTRGRARILDPVTNAQLQVTFVPGLNGGWSYPGDTPNYIVIGIGEAYDWAVVGSPERSSAFVLSRTPALTSSQRAGVLAALEGSGFNPCNLRTTRQRGGLQSVRGFCNV